MILALAAPVLVAAPALAACGGATMTAAPHVSSSAGQVQPTERHGHLGDAIVLCDGGKGRLEVTALGLESWSTIATSDSTVANVYGVKLKLRNVGTTPIHLAAVGTSSALFDVGGWQYYPPANRPKNAITDVDLGHPGDFRVGWVYFAAAAPGGAPNDFQYTVKSSGAGAEGDTGQWKWRPSRL
jgi:hypothetical protein